MCTRVSLGAVFTSVLAATIFFLFAVLPHSTAYGQEVHDAAAVEKEVRTIFEDTPVMIEIARCESKFRQYADSGSVLRGGLGNAMLGVFQFNENVHLVEAATLGFNLMTLDGNLGYAKYLYGRSGTDPWMSSSHCWYDAKTGRATTSSDDTLSDAERTRIQTQITELLRLIAELQKLLVKLRELEDAG